MKSPQILSTSESWVAVDKPAGIRSIPDRFQTGLPNIAGMLGSHFEEIYTVHRLDRDTSGVMVFATSAATHKMLSQQFEERKVSKHYLVLVSGRVSPAEGRIEMPLAHHTARPNMMVVHKRGKEAITTYTVLEQFRSCALLSVQIHTGRTHQIRVHMQYAGHPLLIDPVYGGREAFYLSSVKKKYRLSGEEKPLMARQTLHAASLSFNCPDTGSEVSVEAPLPKDFQAVLNQLRKWDMP